MIPKASRKERLLPSAAAGTAYSVTVYQVSTNRTFILTDLLIETTDQGTPYTIFDGLSAAAPTAGQEKMKFYSVPVRLTDIQNGPEFSTGLSIRSDSGLQACSAYVCWVGGYER